MNNHTLDGSKHGSAAKYRSSRSKWLMALACMWMTFPQLASAITIHSIDPPSASPGEEVTICGSGFSPATDTYAILVVGSSPTAAVVLEVVSIDGGGNPQGCSSQALTLIVGAAEESFQGDLVVLEGTEIGVNPTAFQTDDRVFAVGGSRFSANSCQHLGSLGIDLAGEGSGEALGRSSDLIPSFSSSHRQGRPSTSEPVDLIWAQPMGNGLELHLTPSPYELFYANIPHMIDPEDCGGGEIFVSAPGQIQMTYLSGHASSPLELAEDLATALQYAFADYEGVSVRSGGSWVTVELGREVRGSSMRLEVFSSD